MKEGIITKSEFERLHSEFKRKAREFEEAQKKQELMIKELFKNGVISQPVLALRTSGAEPLEGLVRCYDHLGLSEQAASYREELNSRSEE